MDKILSLQMLDLDLNTDTSSCRDSSISCPSQASCNSHQSTVKVDAIGPGGQAW